MPLEIEAKMCVEDFGPVRGALTRAGAERVGEVLEENIFLDTPDHSLRSRGSGLRLRRNRDVATGRDRHVITFKGPVAPGEMKIREEVELTVESRDDAIKLLERLGYRVELTFEKRRETWTLGGCKVELDELPEVGRFVEIEGPDEATVTRVRQSLGLEKLALMKESYASMVAKSRQQDSTQLSS